MDTNLSNAELRQRLEALTEDAKGIVAKAHAEPGKVEALSADLKSVQDSIAPLLAEQESRARDAELSDMKAQVTTLEGAVQELSRDWSPSAARMTTESFEASPYATGERSFYQDLRRAKIGDAKAMKALIDGKAMTEGVEADGGLLVSPDMAELLEIRTAPTVMRSLLPSVSVTTDSMEFPREAGGLTAGWTAELALKPSADLSFATATVSVFTAAGLAVTSNQLLADAGRTRRGVNMTIDQLITKNLMRALDTLEEVALISGTGAGQPLGIINTPAIGGVNAALNTVPALLGYISQAIMEVQTDFLGDPDGIVMHPRTWNRIVSAQEAGAPSTFLIGAGSTAFGRRANDPIPGGGARPGQLAGELFGYPVYLSANIPTNLGAGNNESCVIVADFSQGLILDREGTRLDTSEHVYFTTNQTVFRAERRLGFTAARYPLAFNLISGVGLAGG